MKWRKIMRILDFSKKSYLTLSVFVLGLVLGSSSITFAAGKEEGSKNMNAEMQAMMTKWQEYASPNENHKVLDVLTGNWNHVVKWWMEPGSKPEISKGTTETRWIMGGRYLQHMVKGMSMGQPFEGMGLIGFDNSQKKYQTLWIDNMGTGIMTGDGSYDADVKTLSDKGTFSDPFIGQRSYRTETKLTGNDHYTYEMYAPDMTGKEYLMMSIAYTRVK